MTKNVSNFVVNAVDQVPAEAEIVVGLGLIGLKNAVETPSVLIDVALVADFDHGDQDAVILDQRAIDNPRRDEFTSPNSNQHTAESNQTKSRDGGEKAFSGRDTRNL